MAESEYTAAPNDGNRPDDDDERDEVRRLDVEHRERRQRLGLQLGAQHVARVAEMVRVNDEDPIESNSGAGTRKPRPVRERSWRGPNAGKKFRSADALRKATLEECHAGFTATWGYVMTPADQQVFGMSVREIPLAIQGREAEARDVYIRLRQAIAAATTFAEQTQNQTYGSATIALGDLWGRLPVLPHCSDLPGFRKPIASRRALVETWQGIAGRGLGRTLTPRELAELSVLLGASDTNYTAFFRRGKEQQALEVSPADVLRSEAKTLEKLLAKTVPT